MRIAIATVQVPFMTGGAEILVNMLKNELIKRGHKAEIVTIPFKWYPWQNLVESMNMGRMMDLTESNGEKIDLVIAMKFPAYYCKSDNKVFWLMHQHRSAYDLWGTDFGDLHHFENGEEIKEFVKACDNKYIPEATKIYTIANNTSRRLKKFNGIDSECLLHPPLNHEKLYCGECGDYVFYPSRISTIKRQRLLVEAAKYMKSDAKVVLAGGGAETELKYINDFIKENHLENKVKLAGFISEEEKINYYANCLAVYFGAYDEDYGYITLEGMFSEKPVIVHPDAGGPLDFLTDGEDGYVVEADAKALAAKIDYLYEHKDEATKFGKRGRKALDDMHMDWDYVIDHLLGTYKDDEDKTHE